MRQLQHIVLSRICPQCGTTRDVIVDANDHKRWIDGVYIQDAFPYLNADARELIMTGFCPNGECWDLATKVEDDDV